MEAPPWLYEAVTTDLTRNGLLVPGKSLTDDDLSRSMTRMCQRRNAALAARGTELIPVNMAGVAGAASLLGRMDVPNGKPDTTGEPAGEPDPQPGMMRTLAHGAQESVTGLAWRQKMPDELTPQEQENLDMPRRILLSTGQMAGDLPTLAAGAGLGLLGGAAAPYTVPAGAMGLTEGTRAALTGQMVIVVGRGQDGPDSRLVSMYVEKADSPISRKKKSRTGSLPTPVER